MPVQRGIATMEHAARRRLPTQVIRVHTEALTETVVRRDAARLRLRVPRRANLKIKRDTTRDTNQRYLATVSTSCAPQLTLLQQVEALGVLTGFPHNPSGRGFEPHPPHRI